MAGTPNRIDGAIVGAGPVAASGSNVASEADIVVVGAGAAGLAAAIFAARARPEARIVALDGAKKLGAKILVAGGGRCNVTNQHVGVDDFFGGSRPFIRRVLERFPVRAAVDFFAEIGVRLHVEEDGKLFPDSQSGRTVLAALLGEAERRGVQLLCGRKVSRIDRDDGRFLVETSGGRVAARVCVLTPGGLALPKSGSDGSGHVLAQQLGHSLIPPTPALVPLLLDGDFHAGLQGVSQPVELTVHVDGARPARFRGALLWTHFGVSGPVVLNVSRIWLRARLEGQTARIRANLIPGFDFAAVERWLLELAGRHPRMALRNALSERLPARAASALPAAIGAVADTPLAHLARDVRRRLATALVEWPLPVRDSRGYTYAEVTAGGVPLDEVDPATLVSRRCPALLLAGEVLDVDGRIGGFNFQWAWASGFVAGQSAAALAASSAETKGATSE